MEKLLVFDFDNIIYRAGFATEKRSIEVTNIRSGRKSTYKNITEFWGRRKNEIGGKLSEYNAKLISKGKEPFTKEDFTYEVIRTSEPLDVVLKTVKSMIYNICEATGVSEYMGYIGKGESFRLERSTLYKYKGNRDEAERPILKNEITQYLIDYHNAIPVEGLEADDWCIIRAYGNPEMIVVAVDKDALGCGVKVFNPDKPTLGIVDCNCFGELTLIEKDKSKDVKGWGRKFFYFQVAYGDSVDNYRSNCVSDLDWGVISAYNALNGAQNDREALQALIDIYKTLYPTPKKVIGWRGDTILVDWLYVLSEVWDMARMKRTETDEVDVRDVLIKFGLLEGQDGKSK